MIAGIRRSRIELRRRILGTDAPPLAVVMAAAPQIGARSPVHAAFDDLTLGVKRIAGIGIYVMQQSLCLKH